MKRVLLLFGGIVAAAFARGDYATLEIAQSEAMADYIRFESRSWAEDATGEGGRLQGNVVWTGEHVIWSDLYIPSGVTLTINPGTVVRFREGTRIKVEDGGRLVITGETGNEVVLKGYEDATKFTGIVLQSSAATYSDNSQVIVEGFTFGKYAAISISDTSAFTGDGQALVPVKLSGSRDTAFSFDWVAETNGVKFAQGTMKWNNVSEGTKNIVVSFPDGLPGCETFTVRAECLRCCTASKGSALVKLSGYIISDIAVAETMADYIPFESDEWNLAQGGDCGRLNANAVWEGEHVITSDLYIPAGVTLTLTANTVVKFSEGTRIKIEDGGTLKIIGAQGNDVVLRGVDGETKFGGIVKMTNGTFTDNSYVQVAGFSFGAFANVALNNSETFRSSGLALIPVTVSGSRTTTFSIDWVAETNGVPYKTGTVTWGTVNDGTRNISINFGHELDGCAEFDVRVAVNRACSSSPSNCKVKIREFDEADVVVAEAMADYIPFESREWAEGMSGEGGRLTANSVWEGAHTIVGDVYIPAGVTLTLVAGADIAFCEGTRIKIEDGGALNIVGANGNDVIFHAAEGVRSFVGIVKMTNGTYTDNMYVQYKDMPYSNYPYVTVHESSTYRDKGKVYIPLTLSGSTRNQSFNVDWETDKGDRGTITWNSSSDGTKLIEVPIDATLTGGTVKHKVTLTAARGCNTNVKVAEIVVYEFDYSVTENVSLTEGTVASEEFAINGDINAQPIFNNESEPIAFSGRWQTFDANEAVKLRVSIESDNGVKVLKEAGVDETGEFAFRPEDYPVGHYTLKHEIVDKVGDPLATMSKAFSVVDREDVVMHGGTLSANEVWKAGMTHVVYAPVSVPSIYTLFIEPGAVVKFLTGTGIELQQGAALFANAIVFTHIDDDTVGGDTLSDGFVSMPPMDGYFLRGDFTFGDDAELRNLTQKTALTGTISGTKMLSKGSTYRVSGTLTIANGAKLTIPAGTVLKMEKQAAIVVNSGGSLFAHGTRAAPIMITSINDDSVSGKTVGSNSNPQPGDWDEIRNAGGTVELTNVSLTWGGYGQYNNQGDAIVRTTGGTTTLDGCTIAHTNLRLLGRSGGTVRAVNCILDDGWWGIDGAVSLVNGVISRCLVGSRGGAVTNTVYYACDTYSSSTIVSSCIAYGESQSVQSGMTYVDPLFVDPDNGDFRIREGSPCVDAADSEAAPELDFYGQPRVTYGEQEGLVGQLADIGICELMPRNVTSDIDLVPESVRIDKSAHAGELVFVKWTIRNDGGVEIDGSWRDSISLVSSSGREVALGEKVTTTRVAPGGTVFCSGYFTVPAVEEGVWFPKVNVNSHRDIFEGSLGANNAMTGSDGVEISIRAAEGLGSDGVLNAGMPTVVKLTLAEDDPNRMVRIAVPSGVKVLYGFGFVPNDRNASGLLTSGADGALFRIPEGVKDVYVVLESETNAQYEIARDESKMEIRTVSASKLPSTGTMTVMVVGAGFEDLLSVDVVSSSHAMPLEFVCLDSRTLSLTIDCASLKAGVYTLRVTGASAEAELANAFVVTAALGTGSFWYEFLLPETARENRRIAVSLNYGNSGTANLDAPIIDVVSVADGMVSLDGENWSPAIRVLGEGGKGHENQILPGEQRTLSLYVLPGKDNSFAVYESFGKDLVGTGWPSASAFQRDFGEAMVRHMATGRGLREYDAVFNTAVHVRDGMSDNCLSGRIVSSAGQPLVHAVVEIVRAGTEGSSSSRYVVESDELGRFGALDLDDGTYEIRAGIGIREEVRLSGGQRVHLELKLDNASVLSVSVAEELWSPGMSVQLRSLDGNQRYLPIGRIGEEEFLFETGVSEGFYRLVASTPERDVASRIVAISSDLPHVFTLDRSSAFCTIRGRIAGLEQHALFADSPVVLRLVGKEKYNEYEVLVSPGEESFEVAGVVADTYEAEVSGVDCSYEISRGAEISLESDMELVVQPVDEDRQLVVTADVPSEGCLFVLAQGNGPMAYGELRRGEPLTLRRIGEGVWNYCLVNESGIVLLRGRFEVDDDHRAFALSGVGTRASKNGIALFGLSDWLSDLFKSFTHWAGEALADILGGEFIDFFESKEWKEAKDVCDEAEAYYGRHAKIGYPGPCCCGYNNQKYPYDQAALSDFKKEILDFSNYYRGCSRMKAIASSSLLVASLADAAAEKVIETITGSATEKILKKLAWAEKIGKMKVRYQAALAAAGGIADAALAVREFEEAMAKADLDMKTAMATLKASGDWFAFVSSMTRLTEYITQWCRDKRNYYSPSNHKFADTLKGVSEVIDEIEELVNVINQVVDLTKKGFDAAQDIADYLSHVKHFKERMQSFVEKYKTFVSYAEEFNHYHSGKDCQPERYPDPEYKGPSGGPYEYPKILHSVDPNEMAGPLGSGDPETERFVKPGEWMTYTVYFENKADATAAAQEVYVSNPLSEYLDWSTFEMGEVAFNNQIDLGLSGKKNGTSEVTMNGTNYAVRTELKLDEKTGVADWYMRIVDPTTETGWPEDVLAGFLLPNDETFRGEGHITYRVKVREDAPPFAVIDNSATIVFDYNDPIETDPAWWNTVSPVEESIKTGDYVKWDLAELGFDVPTDGTAYSVTAYGLPAGLKLVKSAAVTKKVKDKKTGKTKTVVVTPAGATWWIEGVATAALDFLTMPPYLAITANGTTSTVALPLEVIAQDVTDLGEIPVGVALNEQHWLPGLPSGWSVSGLPTGLKYTAKLLTTKKTKTVGKKKVTTVTTNALPDSVYGTPTKAGLYTITAKKKVGGFYETLKYRVVVTPKPVDAALFGETLTNLTTMAYVPFEWDLTNDVAAVGGTVAKVTGLPTGLAFAAKDVYGYTNAKKKTGKYLKQAAQTIVGTPTKPGTYVVTFTKNVKSGKKTVAKTAQIVWTVERNEARPELGFNTSGAQIVEASVGVRETELLAFDAAEGATVKASGLPKGVKLVKLADGRWGFSGTVTSATTAFITVTATINGNSQSQRLAVKFNALPAGAKGTFDGYVISGGYAGAIRLSVTSAGKISGTLREFGTNWTVSASSFAGVMVEDDGSVYVCTNLVGKYTYSENSGKKTVKKTLTRSFTMYLGASFKEGYIEGVENGEGERRSAFEALRNTWSSTYKELGKQLFYQSSKMQYRTYAYTAASEGCEFLAEGEKLTLKITSSGAVTATLTHPTGKKDKKKKEIIYKATWSTTLLPSSAPEDGAENFRGTVVLYFPASSANGFEGLVGTLEFTP